MNCYYHPEQSIVATCQDCNKGLCNECAKKYDIPICTYCNNVRFKEENSGVNNRLIKLIVAGAVGGILNGYVLLGGRFALPLFLFGAFMGIAIYSGWRQTNKITSNLFLFLPVVGWLIYFIVKFFASFFVGIISAPIEIFNIISNKYSIKKRQG